MNIQFLKDHVRTIPHFPKKGIMFRDYTTLLKDPKCLRELSEGLTEYYKDKGITKVIGIESRGFVLGAILANNLNAGFAPVRKPGKLPAETFQQKYSKEYGEDIIEIHKDVLTPDDIVLIHDDLLATGGSMKAAYDLCTKFNVKKIYINCVIEITDPNLLGRKVFDGLDVDIYIPITFAEDE